MSDQESQGDAEGKQEDAASDELAVREDVEASATPPDAEQPANTNAEPEATPSDTGVPPPESRSSGPGCAGA